MGIFDRFKRGDDGGRKKVTWKRLHEHLLHYDELWHTQGRENSITEEQRAFLMEQVSLVIEQGLRRTPYKKGRELNNNKKKETYFGIMIPNETPIYTMIYSPRSELNDPEKLDHVKELFDSIEYMEFPAFSFDDRMYDGNIESFKGDTRFHRFFSA